MSDHNQHRKLRRQLSRTFTVAVLVISTLSYIIVLLLHKFNAITDDTIFQFFSNITLPLFGGSLTLLAFAWTSRSDLQETTESAVRKALSETLAASAVRIQRKARRDEHLDLFLSRPSDEDLAKNHIVQTMRRSFVVDELQVVDKVRAIFASSDEDQLLDDYIANKRYELVYRLDAALSATDDRVCKIQEVTINGHTITEPVKRKVVLKEDSGKDVDGKEYVFQLPRDFRGQPGPYRVTLLFHVLKKCAQDSIIIPSVIMYETEEIEYRLFIAHDIGVARIKLDTATLPERSKIWKKVIEQTPGKPLGAMICIPHPITSKTQVTFTLSRTTTAASASATARGEAETDAVD